MRLKKLLSTFLAFCILLSCISAVTVSADTEAAELIYDMDLSKYAADSTISNTAGNDSISFALTDSTTGTVSADSFVNSNKSDVPYISMKGADSQLAYQSTASDMVGESYTMEAWVQIKHTNAASFPSNAYGRPFMTVLSNGGPETYGKDENANLAVRLANSTDRVNENGENTTQLAWGGRYATVWLSTTYNHDDWVKFTVVREVTNGDNTTTISKKLYVNGSKNYTGRNGSYSEKTYTTTDALYEETELSFGLGNIEIAFEEFNIADVKLYKGVRTETQIADDYNTEKNSYIKAEPSQFLIYDMDLSEYTNENPKVKDRASGTASVVNGTPVIGRKGKQDYLTFRTVYEDRANAVTVTDDEFANQDSMSFEFWFRGTQLISGGAESRICSLALGNTNGDIKYEIYNSPSGNFWFRMDGLKSDGSENTAHRMSKNMNDYNESWTHIVFNREWVPVSTGSDEGKWKGELYINGVKSQTATSSATTTRTDETGLYLTVGNKSSNTTAFYGDIATFKVYSTLLASDVVTANYEAGLLNFTDEEVGISFKNPDDDSDIQYLDYLDAVEVYYTGISDTASLFVACYDRKGNLVSVQSPSASGSGSIDAELAQGTTTLKVFVWEQETLKPLKTATEIGYSEGYKSQVFADGAFYDASGNEIKSIKDQSTITAKIECASMEPQQKVYTSLVLEREGEEIDSAVVPVSFADGIANVSVSLEDITALEGDIVTLSVYDSSKVYYTKKIGYDDLSKIVDVILVAGQSNALGQGGSTEESIKTEPDTVYYQKMGDNTFATTGNEGWASSLGKTWHDETGHTALVVKATWGGTGFPVLVDGVTGDSDRYGYWNPGNSGSTSALPRDCYTLAKNYYDAAIASIDTNEYTIGERIYFWNQGENENRYYTAEQYEKAFLELHNSMLKEFGTEDTRLTCGAILPIRSRPAEGVPANLKLTGPRIAQYKLAQERSDLFMVSDATEHWYSDSAIADWFKNSSGYVYSEMPDAWTDIMNSDNLHYTQLAMNELGREAAINMLTYLSGGMESEGLDLITPSGIQHYNDGDSIYLTEDGAIPKLPAASGKKAVFELTGNGAEITEAGLLMPKSALLNDYTTLKVTQEGSSKSMTFKLYSPIVDETVTIAAIKDNKSAIYTLSTDDGYAETNLYLDTKLRELGLVGTLGIVPAYIGTVTTNNTYLTWDEAEKLVNCEDSVWDVANHTENHLQADFPNLTAEELEVEIDGGRDTLLSHFPGEKILAMYTPGGQTSDLIRSKVKENHLVLRMAGGGFNSLPIDESGLLTLRCQALGSYASSAAADADTMNGWVDTAINNGQWLCEMWHGVGEKDAATWNGNVSKEAADAHLAYVAAKNNSGILWVTTLDEAAIYAVQRARTQISMIENQDGRMVFAVIDPLAGYIYDSELTLNVALTDNVTITSVTCGGRSVTYEVFDGGISFNVLPNSGNVEILYE
ncbi:MAG: hypothetical protein IJ454_02670 [Clostridia bacterium]|nr:hypothetical protein [Clostridia bacterium]